MSDNTSDSDEWFQARKRPVAVEARGPYTDPDQIETLEGDFEVDDEYIDEHGGYYIIRGVENEEYPCAADIFERTYDRDGERLGSPIIHAGDGPRLILANGQVVEPMVFDGEGEELFAFQVDQGQTIYGPEVDDAHTKLAFVDDPDPFEIEAVRERLDAYGFGSEAE